MDISLRRVNALVKKEMKDFTKNINVSLMCLIPLVLVLLFRNLQGGGAAVGSSGLDLLMLGLNTNLVMVSAFGISMLIAEEKEKNTMRTLMLSSVRPAEFLAGKAIVILLFSILTNAAIYMIVEMDPRYLPHYLLWSLVVTGVMMQIGGIIGLLAKNQMSTSVLGVPVIFGFMMIPMLAEANDTLETVASYLPNHNLGLILEEIIYGGGYAEASQSLLLILAWVLLSSAAFILIYNKKRLDA